MNPVAIDREYVDGRFGQLHVYYTKQSTERNTTFPPLMCFHMSPFAATIYEKFITEMGKDRLCIAVDTPGYGNSDPPEYPPLICDYAAAMSDVMNALEIESADVMGFHTGSKIGLELAIQQPKRVRRIIMVSMAYWTQAEQTERQISIQAPEIAEDGSHLMSLWQEMLRWSMTGRTHQMVADSFYASLLNPSITHWGHQAAYQYDVEAALSEVKQPIMVLNPQDDLWEQTPRIKPLLHHPDNEFHDLPGWAHGFLDLKTAETADLARRFLAQ